MNIIDEYQTNREDDLALDEDKTDVSMLITESAKLSFISQENALGDAYDGFSIKVMDHGIISLGGALGGASSATLKRLRHLKENRPKASA